MSFVIERKCSYLLLRNLIMFDYYEYDYLPVSETMKTTRIYCLEIWLQAS